MLTMTMNKRCILIFILCLLKQPYTNSFQISLKPATNRRKVLLNKNIDERCARLKSSSASRASDNGQRCSKSPSSLGDSPLFSSPLSRKRNVLSRCFRLVPFLMLPLILASSFPTRAGTASIRQSLNSIQSAVPWKRAVRALLSMVVISATVSNIRMKKRQAKNATIEWARYAKNPSARGRAILWLLTQQAVFIVLSKIIWFRRSTIRKFAGEQFTQSLLKLGPLYIKMGQIMSCRKNLLGSEWIEAMAILQDEVPSQTGDEAMELAYSTLEGGKAEFESLFSEFDSTPLAAASLGQVHRAKLRKLGDVVAVKVQRPFLRQIYDQDLQFLEKIAKFMDNIPGSAKNVGGVSSSWTKIFSDAEVILYREIDYRAEAENAIRFSEDFGLTLGGKAIASPTTSKDGKNLPSAADWIRTPYVFEEVSNERLLVMEFIPSMKITNITKLDTAGVTASDRIDLADALARAYLRQLCCNLFFSTDPHAGNLGVEIMESGKPRLVIYDFGQAASLTQDQADGILGIVEAIIDMDVEQSIDAFVKMGVLVDGADLDKVRAKVAENYRTGKVKANRKKLRRKGYQFKNENETQSVATDVTDIQTKDSEVLSFFTLPAEYAFVARALSQMDGVGKVLDPDFDFISNSAPYIVEIKGAKKFLKEEVVKFFKNFQRRLVDIQMRQIPEWYENVISKN